MKKLKKLRKILLERKESNVTLKRTSVRILGPFLNFDLKVYKTYKESNIIKRAVSIRVLETVGVELEQPPIPVPSMEHLKKIVPRVNWSKFLSIKKTEEPVINP